MTNRWQDDEAQHHQQSPLAMRVYTSQLLGRDPALVLHGGGNTSVKITETSLFGETADILYVKGSGWDLATIEAAGFAPVKMKALLQMAQLETMNDREMVRQQRMAMTDPNAPNPSVEAILHAIIPFRFVDHTHADAVVTISNTPNGRQRIEDVYGEDFLIVPYIMPGFILAREVFLLTRQTNWRRIKGIILMHHGIFTFHDDAKTSYENMIEAVTRAENYLEAQGATGIEEAEEGKKDPLQTARLRRQVSAAFGKPVFAVTDRSAKAAAFSSLPQISEITGRGPLTPDHIIRTKRIPALLTGNFETDIKKYTENYREAFERLHAPHHIMPDPAPRWAVWPGHGTVYFDTPLNSVHIIRDICEHTMTAIYQAGQLGGWTALPERDLFDMEYWELEQDKLKKTGAAKPMQGKIALVTGAASGIGKACVEALLKEGAVVAALDINPVINNLFKQKEVLALECDVTQTDQLRRAVENTVLQFGGLDMLVANAGIFPKSRSIAEMDEQDWNRSLQINLTSQHQLLSLCIPFLELGHHPAVVIVGSKNVAAPGPGAAAYSVAKAGLTQLGRVAAMELGPKGIRVNMIHPNAVFDTGIWTEEVIAARAAQYKQSVEEYKSNNFLHTEITSADVARLAVTMLGPAFEKITGAQVPIDGGNERTV